MPTYQDFFKGMGLRGVKIHTEESKKETKENTKKESKIPNPKEGWFKRIQMYIHPFLSSANEDPLYETISNSQKWLHTNTPNKDIIILLPKHEFQFIPLKIFLFHQRNIPSIYHYKNSGLDFFHIQHYLLLNN